MKIWDNTGTCVFVAQDEGPPMYLFCTGISNIEWSVVEGIVCLYCGSTMEGARCPNCSGTAPGTSVRKLGPAVVTLEGILPQAISIFHLPEGAELLLCYKCRGDRLFFDAREVIMRFLHCHQVAKNMPDVVQLHIGREERLRVLVSVECDVEMYPDGMGAE